MSAVRLRPGVLVQLRRRSGLLQSQVADRLAGVSRKQSIGDWERGRAQPQPRFIPPLAAALGVTPLELLNVDAQDPPLQALRLAAGLSLQDLEVSSGISYTRCRRLEFGQVNSDIDEETALALAHALDVNALQVRRAVARSRQP